MIERSKLLGGIILLILMVFMLLTAFKPSQLNVKIIALMAFLLIANIFYYHYLKNKL